MNHYVLWERFRDTVLYFREMIRPRVSALRSFSARLTGTFMKTPNCYNRDAKCEIVFMTGIKIMND